MLDKRCVRNPCWSLTGKLDEGNGTRTADSAGNKSGTLENDVAWTAGVSRAAVNLDGVDDYIDLPRLDLTDSTITPSAWVINSSFATGVSRRTICVEGRRLD